MALKYEHTVIVELSARLRDICPVKILPVYIMQSAVVSTRLLVTNCHEHLSKPQQTLSTAVDDNSVGILLCFDTVDWVTGRSFGL